MPSNRLIHVFFLFISISLLINKPAIADIDEIYHLSIGSNIARYNSSISINSQDTSAGTIIDFEDDLGFDNKLNAGWISGWYRVGDVHRLKLTYTPVKRSAFITNTKDIIIDNTTIKSGAAIASDTKSEILDFSYIYSFHKSSDLELGFSTGIYWLFNNTKIVAAGEIQAEGDDQAVFRSDYLSEQKLQAPMPLLGLSANYEIIPSWRTHAALRYLSAQIGEYRGDIFVAEIGTEYYFNDNWGIGASFATFDLDVEVKGIIASTELNWDYSSIQLYAVVKY